MKKLVLLSAVLLSILLSGCGSKTVQMPVAATDAPIPVEDNSADSSTGKKTSFSMGETIVTDQVKLTLNNIIFHEYTDISRGSKMYATDDNIFASLDLTIKNISNSEISAHRLLDVVLDYNDGFLYNTRDLPTLLVDDEGDYYMFYSNGSGRGSGISINMKPQKEYHYYLELQCHKVLAKDTESPLRVYFHLPNRGMLEEYTYVIR